MNKVKLNLYYNILMIIFGFDCAIENLGICIVVYDEEWRKKVENVINELCELYNSIDQISKTKFIDRATEIVKCAVEIVDNMLVIKWFNVIDLIPGEKTDEVPALERTRRIKCLLNALDKQFDKPDLVLIEYQMGPNDISRMISAQISYHYMSDIELDIKLKTSDIRKSQNR